MTCVPAVSVLYLCSGDEPHTLPASSQLSWRHRWGFLRWGWCRGSWERCCRACGPLRGPTEREPPSGLRVSCRADHWERWLSCNRAAGAKEDRRKLEGCRSFRKKCGCMCHYKKVFSPLPVCLNTLEHPAGCCLQGSPASQTPTAPKIMLGIFTFTFTRKDLVLRSTCE